MPKDKEGNKLTWKEFFKKWKQGIDGVTVMQQVKMQIQSTYIMILGMILGIIVSGADYKHYWWIMVVLIGGIFNTGISLITLYQKKHQLEFFDNLQLQVTDQETKTEVLENV